MEAILSEYRSPHNPAGKRPAPPPPLPYRTYLAPPSRDYQRRDGRHDDASIEDGYLIGLIAQALVALVIISGLMWAIGQASAAQDRALVTLSQVQP
jgi:hypothetical protein